MTHSGNLAREMILELWTRTRIDWGFATDRISEAFRRRRDINSHERREVAETLYGMIRQARRVDFALDPVSVSAGDERELMRYLAYRLLAGEMSIEECQRERAADWKAVAAVDERIARERDPVVRFGLQHSFPDWLAERFLNEYPGEADALAVALNQRAPLTIRTNTLKIARDALSARLAIDGIASHPTRFAAAGLILDTRTNVFGLAAFKEGLFDVQDEASQLAAEIVAPPPRGYVIDACAGAGGKTLALGALMANKGRLVALDVDERKLEELRRRARRAGLSNVRAIAIDDAEWNDDVEAMRGQADRVLVDAPCTGIGALRRNPEARWRLTPEDLERLPRTQERIAKRAQSLVAVGGRLIYATCTLLRAENEGVVEKLLGPGWEPVRAAEIWGTERAMKVSDVTCTNLKILPHRHDADGFFAAVLRRRA